MVRHTRDVFLSPYWLLYLMLTIFFCLWHMRPHTHAHGSYHLVGFMSFTNLPLLPFCTWIVLLSQSHSPTVQHLTSFSLILSHDPLIRCCVMLILPVRSVHLTFLDRLFASVPLPLPFHSLFRTLPWPHEPTMVNIPNYWFSCFV